MSRFPEVPTVSRIQPGGLDFLPTTWRGCLQMTGIDLIAHVSPAGTGG